MNNRSPTNIHYSLHSSKKSQTISLPSINKPQREQIDSFLSQDREKIRQKLKENCFQKDISYLKESSKLNTYKSEYIQTDSTSEILPSTLTEILSLIHPELKLSHSILKLINSRQPTKHSDLKHLLKLSKNDFSVYGSPTNPSSRQVALNLKNWLDHTENKYIPILNELVNTPGFEEKQLVIKAWKSIYAVTNKELIRQVTIHCSERGNLLQKALDEIENLSKLEQKIYESQLADIEKKQECKLSEFIQPYLSELSLLQSKVQRLEKEKEKWTKNKAEIIVKSKELISYLEVLRKFEDQVKHIKGKSKYFDSYINFFNSMAVEEMSDFSCGNVKDKLKDELNGIIKEIFKNKQKLQKNSLKLKNLEDDIVDKESKLASLAFEIEVKENISRPKLKKNEKFLSLCESISTKKESSPLPKLVFEDEKIICEKFFKKLVAKSKDRLIKKSKVSTEHIFKSLGVIYNRCVTQINLNPTFASDSFQFLLYKQFVKGDNKKSSERNLKNFLSGCLKICDFRRASIFLRLLNFGGWIDKDDFSHKTFLLYLSLFLFMQNSPIGLLVYKDQVSPIQYYPYSRAVACLKEYKSMLSKNIMKNLKNQIEKLKINDPKQINPNGIIELELFLEVFLQEHEKMLIEIIENLKILFTPFGEVIDKEIFVIGLNGVSGVGCKDLIEKEVEKINEIFFEDCVDVACRVKAGINEIVVEILKEFTGLSEEDAKRLAKSRLMAAGTKIADLVVESIEDNPAKFGILWMKILCSD
jgi:hypothetical protein